MKLITTFSLLIISSQAFAYNFLGEYELLKESSLCPVGEISFVKMEDEKRVLLFGARDSWELSKEDEGKFTEKVPDSCRYTYEYKLTKDKFLITTSISECKNPKENGKVSQALDFRDGKLIYSYHSDVVVSKNKKFSCMYKKI